MSLSRTTWAVVLGIALPTLGLGGAWVWTTLAARDARARERAAVLARSAEAVGAAVDESLDELRAREDARPFYLYDHFYTPPEVLSLTATIAVSPLAAAPDDPRVVGYFQVDPGGTVRTPYEAEPGSGDDARARRVTAVAREAGLAPLRAYAYLAPGASSDDGPLAPRRAPPPLADATPVAVPHRHARTRVRPARTPTTVAANTANVAHTASVATVANTANAANAANAAHVDNAANAAPPRQVTVELNSYSNMLYGQVTQAQAGDPAAQAYVAQAQQAPPTRNAVSWEAQATQQAMDTGYAPPAVPQAGNVGTLPNADATQQAVAQREASRPRARVARPAQADARPGQEDARRGQGDPRPRQGDLPPEAPQPAAAREPDRADAVDYTPMAYASFDGTVVLWRVVSHAGASSVQGVVLDRAKLLREWVPALVRRHALAGATPRVVVGAPGRADLARPLSASLPGVVLVFPSGTLARAAAADDRALFLEALALLGLVLAIVATGVVVDRAARRSAALARQRSAFVTAVSHELRTPLTTIRMHAELLRDGLVPEPKRAKFHADIAQESVRLARLVENVLEATRLEEGRRPVRLMEGDLAAHVRHVAESQRALCTSRGATLVVSVPESLPAHFDAQAVELLVVNLVENAVKHGLGDAREVEVALAGEDGRVELHVRDRGPGVPAPEREKVFERFHRIERAGAEHVVGTGLGLALVRELARAHRSASGETGDARVVPRDGGGADFVVTLPT